MKFTIILCEIFLCSTAFAINCQSLIERSPFHQKYENIEPSTKNLDADGLELHGICAIGNDYFFSILNINSKKSQWVKLGDKVSNLYVKKYKKKNNTIELATPSGEFVSLKLKTPELGRQQTTKFHKENFSNPGTQQISSDARRKFLDTIREERK